MNNSINIVKQQLRNYKSKYYKNLIIKGLIYSFSLIISALLLFTFLEYLGHFNTTIRTSIFFLYIAIVGYSITKWIIIPGKKLINIDSELSDENAAQQIGEFFPDIKDKLLNTLQLFELSDSENDLIRASIEQRSEQFSGITFSKAIDYKKNKQFLWRYLLAPFCLLFLILIFIPNYFTESANRIVRYNEEIIQQAPFNFIIENENLTCFKNEDFELKVNVEGESVPTEMFYVENSMKRKMLSNEDGSYNIQINNIQQDISFQLYANGFFSQTYTITFLQRPEINSFNITLEYPKYIQKKKEEVKNGGSLTVPEGTNIIWRLNTAHTEALYVQFSDDSTNTPSIRDRNTFTFNKKALNTATYSIKGENKNSINKEKIEYQLNVIKDQHPTISLSSFNDTVLYSSLFLSGNIGDDYGITALKLFYKTSNKQKNFKKLSIPFNRNQTHQTFFYNLQLDSLAIAAGDQIEYYIQVWDNDAINGSKHTATRIGVFNIPSKEKVEEEIKNSSAETAKAFDQTLKETQKFRKELNKLNDKIKTKKDLSWQDKKDVEKLVNQHKELDKQVNELKKNFNKTQEQSKRFEKQNDQIKQKLEQLDKLMKDLLDEETKKLMEELEKLLKEESKPEKLQEQLDKLEQKDKNLENELDRTLEMFKQMRFDQKLEDTKNKLEELAEKQEKLAEKTKESKDQEALKEEQEKLDNEFEDLKKDLDELNDINEDLKNKNDIENFEEQEKGIEEEMQESQENLDSKKNKKASESQKGAAEKMKQMAQQMKQMQSSMAAEQAQENLDDLRDILENLITLSFEEESLMKDFRSVRQNDPRFVTLSQQQLKLNDDAKIIEDSLLSLAERVFEIQSFVTREVGDMKYNMQQATNAIKERKASKASGKQQMAMTSINNLALMLNDAMKQMQEQMAQQMKGDQMCNKPGGKGKGKGKGGKKPEKMGDMQKGLNDMIKQLKDGQKSGRQLSEELANLAQQQQQIRKALNEAREKMSGDIGGKLDEGKDENGNKPSEELDNKLKALEKLMEETETDLVNKRLSQKTIERQQEIMTRLLEAEKAIREKDFENERESKTGKENERTTTPEIEEYIRQKEKEIELLKTVPPNFNPYYKQETNEYFQTIEN